MTGFALFTVIFFKYQGISQELDERDHPQRLSTFCFEKQ